MCVVASDAHVQNGERRQSRICIGGNNRPLTAKLAQVVDAIRRGLKRPDEVTVGRPNHVNTPKQGSKGTLRSVRPVVPKAAVGFLAFCQLLRTTHPSTLYG